MNSYDETPWWCQLLWPWFGPPWYAEIEDPDTFWAAIARQFVRQAGELADELAGDDRPGEGYLAKAGRLTAARYQAEEIIRHEYGPLTSDRHDDCDDQDEPSRFRERPIVMDRNHPSWQKWTPSSKNASTVPRQTSLALGRACRRPAEPIRVGGAPACWKDHRCLPRSPNWKQPGLPAATTVSASTAALAGDQQRRERAGGATPGELEREIPAHWQATQ